MGLFPGSDTSPPHARECSQSLHGNYGSHSETNGIVGFHAKTTRDYSTNFPTKRNRTRRTILLPSVPPHLGEPFNKHHTANSSRFNRNNTIIGGFRSRLHTRRRRFSLWVDPILVYGPRQICVTGSILQASHGRNQNNAGCRQSSYNSYLTHVLTPRL